LALELELSLKVPLNRRCTFKTKERCSACEGHGNHAYECPSIKCSKCEEFEHYGYQCPSKSLHIDIVRIDDIDNSRIVEDVHIPSGVTSGVDEIIKSSTPAHHEIHVHEESISDIQGA